ncbi:MAG: hypothetical protein ABSF95_04305 [Verrucomicrobiota bacterium]|jgi:hypothetical protein
MNRKAGEQMPSEFLACVFGLDLRTGVLYNACMILSGWLALRPAL